MAKPIKIWDGTTWQEIAGLPGADGVDGTNGTNGTDGADGIGVPAGGTTGQVLAKNSATDYDTEWIDFSSGPNQLVTAPKEPVTIAATAFSGYTFDLKTASIVYLTSNASSNGTVNFRGDVSTTLNSILSVGEAISCVLNVTNGSTAYYPNAFQIDGSAVTPKWQGGSAPTGGNASSIDTYNFTIIKTSSSPTYVVLASQTRYA